MVIHRHGDRVNGGVRLVQSGVARPRRRAPRGAERRLGFATGSPVARLAPGDVHHPPDRKSGERPTVVQGVRVQRRRRRAEGGPPWIARIGCSGAVLGPGGYGSGSCSAWLSSPGSSSSSRTQAVARAASTEERPAGSCRPWGLDPHGRSRTVTSVFLAEELDPLPRFDHPERPTRSASVAEGLSSSSCAGARIAISPGWHPVTPAQRQDWR